ncbi:MAG TPA: multicopper oxidase family protein [Gemmatimonadales bacterium]|nr:multicopper oxidase family protein [Gemmatimonadales bacterium]
MPTRHPDPGHPDHAAHDHGQHGAVMHGPAADAGAAYDRAYAAAQPDAGRTVVAIDLEARPTDWSIAPGVTLEAWAFNGRVPGPTLEARVGDVLEVRLTNHLSEPTAIHWHGLRVPAAMDGTDMVQRPVRPGETFTYRFKLPDAGTFWYHPHINETEQMERGLYGALVVRADGEPVLDGDRVLVLDDVRLDRQGRIAKFGGLVQWHDGREGDARLVNGVREPDLTMAAGQIERWRIVNASSARYVRLSIGGVPFQIIGTDGGLLEAPVSRTDVLLAPADRVEIAVGPFEEGEELAIEALAYSRSTIRRRRTERFATLRVGPAGPSVAVLPERLRTIAPLAASSATPTRTVDFGIKVSLRRGIDFVINKEMHHRDAPVKVGELQVWDVVNSTLMDHPFHLHGFFFQVLAVNGKPPAWRSWEDVVNLPPRSTTRIAWMPDDRPGSWMYHCHILEHHAAGMMAHFDVVP